uniref:Uncharacterized protein n=1 Tax=Rhizophora mucronata TaxID=61149 RepID=A0A2P2PHM1_RHIMU
MFPSLQVFHYLVFVP